tara:strand:- start:256 stop:519 length:264 start_codon:yes stop_codon:yes gene_type:complete
MTKKKPTGAKKKHANEDYSTADAYIHQRIQDELARNRYWNKLMDERTDHAFYGLLALAGLIFVSFTPAAVKAWRFGLQCSHSNPVRH